MASGAVVFLVLAAACKENLSVPNPPPGGPDTQSPVVQLFPGSDTTVDSTGILSVRVHASDQSAMKVIELSLTPARLGFGAINPSDSTFDGQFQIPLSAYKHSTFSFSVRAVDVLDNQTDTPAVTVTVR